MVWNRIPKSTCLGADQVNMGVYLALAHFNIGSKAILEVLERFGCRGGMYTAQGCRKSKIKRPSNAERKQRKEAIERRHHLRGKHNKRKTNIKRRKEVHMAQDTSSTILTSYVEN